MLKNIGKLTFLKMWHIENGMNKNLPNGGFGATLTDYSNLSNGYSSKNIQVDMENKIGGSKTPLVMFMNFNCCPIGYREYWTNREGDIWDWSVDRKNEGVLKSELVGNMIGKYDENDKLIIVLPFILTFSGYSANNFTTNVIGKFLKKIRGFENNHKANPRQYLMNFRITKEVFDNGQSDKKGVSLIKLVEREPIVLDEELTDNEKNPYSSFEIYKELNRVKWTTEYKQRNFVDDKWLFKK